MATELEQSLIASKPKLEPIDILKEAASIPCKNLKFVIFSVLTSLPLLCFLVFYDAFLGKTLVFASNYSLHARVSSYDDGYYSYDSDSWSRHESMSRSYANLKDLCVQLGKFCFLYLVPYQMFEVFSLVAIVGVTSDIYNNDNNNNSNNRTIGLKDMVLNSFDKTKLVRVLVTSIYVMFFSSATLIGLLWIVINYCIMSGSFSAYYYGYSSFYRDDFSIGMIVLIFPHGVAFLGLLRKYLEWSGGWNMSLVISVVEEARGGDALDESDYFIRGSERRGLDLMGVFFLWMVGLRVLCVFLGCGERIVVSFGVMSLVCLGNVVKWVACVVYFCDCKRRVLEKKIDMEVGSVGF